MTDAVRVERDVDDGDPLCQFQSLGLVVGFGQVE